MTAAQLQNRLVFGKEAVAPPPIALRAGPLQLLYDPASGFIRRLCLNEREVLRGIYAALRDANWNTVPGLIRETRREVRADSFHFEFESEHCQAAIRFLWRGSVRGQSDGTIHYQFDGEARSTFLRNRIGFCVLHPIRECAGARARQTRTNSVPVECQFPENIEPQLFGRSSFRDLRSLAHQITPGLWAEVDFQGDVFEMEDQRNWSDASFKTYSTPLALPFPVEIQAGTRIQQSVTVRLVGAATSTGAGGSAPVVIPHQPRARVTVALPERGAARRLTLGVGTARHGEALTQKEMIRLRRLRLAHLRVDLRLSAPHWPAVWERASREAQELETRIELALHLPRAGQRDLIAFQQHLHTQPPSLARVLALREGESATSLETLQTIRRALAGLEVPVGAGSDANFCELNREQALGRLGGSAADFLFWSINPQAHAFDSLSVMETLEAQADTVKTAQAFAGGKPLVISPVTLSPRFNAVAPLSPSPGTVAPPLPVDPRQFSLFAAAWTLGSLAALAGAGVESATFYESTGGHGIMEMERGSLALAEVPVPPGAVFPVYHLLGDLAQLDFCAPAVVSAPDQIAALSVFDGEGPRRLLLANLKAQSLCVHLRALAWPVQVRMLDGENVAEAALHPESFRSKPGSSLAARGGGIILDLPPHALARVDLPNGRPSPQS